MSCIVIVEVEDTLTVSLAEGYVGTWIGDLYSQVGLRVRKLLFLRRPFLDTQFFTALVKVPDADK